MTEETVAAEMPVDAPLPETPETEVTAQPVEAEAPDDAGTEPQEEKPKGGFQRRIKEVTDDRNYWRELAMRNAQQEQQRPVESPKAQEPVKLPTLEEYGYDEAKYQVALLEYADKRAEAVVERRLTEAEKQRAEQARIETFVTRQKEFAKATPDFEDKVLRDPTLPISEAMREVILDSPSGPEIAYHLAGHRDVAERIARLPAHLAAFEIGRIEGRLTAEKAAKARPSTVTQAPPPAPSIDASAPDLTPRASSADSDQLSDDEWMRLRNKELKRKKG